MATKINFDGRGKPPKAEAIRLGVDESGFGEIHLLSDTLHPFFTGRLGEDADSRRVSGEGFISESVNLVDGYGHGKLPPENAKNISPQRAQRTQRKIKEYKKQKDL
jgi:hypothetical protein